MKKNLSDFGEGLRHFYDITDRIIFGKMMNYFSKSPVDKSSNCFTIWGIRMRSPLEEDDGCSLTDDDS